MARGRVGGRARPVAYIPRTWAGRQRLPSYAIPRRQSKNLQRTNQKKEVDFPSHNQKPAEASFPVGAGPGRGPRRVRGGSGRVGAGPGRVGAGPGRGTHPGGRRPGLIRSAPPLPPLHSLSTSAGGVTANVYSSFILFKTREGSTGVSPVNSRRGGDGERRDRPVAVPRAPRVQRQRPRRLSTCRTSSRDHGARGGGAGTAGARKTLSLSIPRGALTPRPCRHSTPRPIAPPTATPLATPPRPRPLASSRCSCSSCSTEAPPSHPPPPTPRPSRPSRVLQEPEQRSHSNALEAAE